MAPVIIPKIKEEPFLVSSDYLRNTGFILACRVSCSINSRRGGLVTMVRYKSNAHII